jgi:hypothetical protein
VSVQDDRILFITSLEMYRLVHIEDGMCAHLAGMAVELKVNKCTVKLTFDVGK